MKKCWIAAGLAAAMVVTSLTGCEGIAEAKKQGRQLGRKKGCGERNGKRSSKRADRTVWRYGKV